MIPWDATEHPRVCGENLPSDLLQLCMHGTSPRMRGKLAVTVRLAGVQRNIPAYAGKTWPRRQHRWRSAEHPRVCGENSKPAHLHNSRKGTSPRMRGKRFLVPSAAVGARNIPAYAGKTFTLFSLIFLYWEHPRVCGENIHSHRIRQTQTGTSPRMRGKPTPVTSKKSSSRNIPAYAGKTYGPYAQRNQPAEHPRVCGENPLGWLMGPEGGEHPRVCGENQQHHWPPLWCSGTSPRMRGKRKEVTMQAIELRNIPAYAGKTAQSSSLCR